MEVDRQLFWRFPKYYDYEKGLFTVSHQLINRRFLHPLATHKVWLHKKSYHYLISSLPWFDCIRKHFLPDWKKSNVHTTDLYEKKKEYKKLENILLPKMMTCILHTKIFYTCNIIERLKKNNASSLFLSWYHNSCCVCFVYPYNYFLQKHDALGELYLHYCKVQ